jgi:hypothetical protein
MPEQHGNAGNRKPALLKATDYGQIRVVLAVIGPLGRCDARCSFSQFIPVKKLKGVATR